MSRFVRPFVLALFFLTGACGLVYEVVWMRMLTLVFGATALATSTILASFFTGLALGSFLFGRVADRARRPLLVYGLLEAGVGVFAFLMPLLFAGLTEVYVVAAQHFDLGHAELTLVRFALSFLVLLIPATLMGGTLPVVVRFFTTRDDTIGWNVGRLYAINTFGAVAGAVSAGFFLILLLGMRETAWIAGTVNLVIATVVILLALRVDASVAAGEASTGADTPAPEAHTSSSSWTLSPGLARLALWAVGISGFCALSLEVLWTRSLVYFLDNSTHAFTTMLAAFLLGIAIGSAVIARWLDGRRRPLVWLGWIEVLIGVSAVLAIPILNHSSPVLQRMAETSVDTSLWWRWAGMRFLTSLTVMLVPTALMGMTVPLVTRIYAARADRVGTALGRVYAVNTVGGVLGSLVAGFLMIPLVGLRNGILIVGAVNLVLGAVILLSDPGVRLPVPARALAGGAVAVLAAAGVYGARGSMVLSSYIERLDGIEVLSYDEGIGANVKVFRDSLGAKYISIDGFPVAGTSLGLHDAQKALGNIPMLLNRVDTPRVNLIGFGAGGASWGVLQYDVASVDCVELVPSVIEAAPYFADVNHGVLDHPRYNLILNDGRNHALVSDATYDVISIDATSPKMAGNGSLYTTEFYRLLERRLSEQGLVAQWLPFHLLSDREMRMTARTFMEVFPHTTLWLSAIRHHALLIGTRKELRIDLTELARKMEREGVRRELETVRVADPVDFLGGFVMDERGLAEYVRDAQINSDDHPYLEFMPAMAFFASTRFLVENLTNFVRYRQSVVPMLVGLGGDEESAVTTERVSRRIESTQHGIAGDVYYYLGLQDRAEAAWDSALAIDPDDKNWASPVWWEDLPLRVDLGASQR